MSYNKKALLSIVKKLDKAKAPGKPKDIIKDPMGQWKYPGQNTRIPGNNITMQGVNYPVWAQPNVGPGAMMEPGQDYSFPGADYVDEFPQNEDFYEDDLDEEQIAELRAGGYIVEDISVPQLTQAQKGISISDPDKYAYRKGMYDDSLSLYNAYQFQKKNINPIPINKIFVDDYNKTSKAYPDIRRPGEPLVITVNDMIKKRNKNFNKNLPKFSHAEYLDTKKNPSDGFDPMHKPSGDYTIYDYNKKLKFNYPVALGKHSSPDIWHSKIEPSGSYFDGVAYSPIYKKPVQAIYKPGEVPTSDIESTKNEISLKTKPLQEINLEEAEIIQSTNKPVYEPTQARFAYRNQAVYEYDKDTKKFSKDSVRKAPLPYAEKYSGLWEANSPKDVPDSGFRVWVINGKEYYNQEDAKAAANQYEELPSYNFQVGGQKEGEVLDIPEMQAYADPAKRKQQHKLIDKARAIASTIEGRQALKQGNYKDFSIENMKKFIKSATDYKKEAEDYHKARRLVSEDKMDSDSFARRYNEKGWAKFDEDVANENYKGEYQQAVDKANKRKGKNMAYTDAVLEFTGAPALQRIAADPIGTAKGVGQTIGDLATLPYGVAEGAYNYATDGNFDMGTNAFGQKYGEGVNETLDVLAVAPAFAGVSKITDLATPALIKGVNKLGKTLGTESGVLSNAYKVNPWAFKPDQSKFYRQIGKAGLDDALSSNVIKSADQTTFPRPYFVEGKDFKMLEQTGSGAHGRPSVMFETPGVNSEGFPFVSPANGSAEYTPWIADMAEVPLTEGKLLQKDWLQGYKEVPRELPGSPNAVIPENSNIITEQRTIANKAMESNDLGGNNPIQIGDEPNPNALYTIRPDDYDDMQQALTMGKEDAQLGLKRYFDNNVLSYKDPKFTSEYNAAKFKMETGLDQPGGPQIGTDITKWKGVDKEDLFVPSIEDIKKYNLDQKGMVYPSHVRNETLISREQELDALNNVQQKALKSGDIDLANEYEKYIAKLKSDALKEYSKPYTADEALRTTTSNASNTTTGEIKGIDLSKEMRDEYNVISKAIEDARAKKVDNWQTPEGRKRLQDMIDNTPALKSANVTPESYVEGIVNMSSENKNYLEKLYALDKTNDEIMRVDALYAENKISENDWVTSLMKLEDEVLKQKNDILDARTSVNNFGSAGASMSSTRPVDLVKSMYDKNGKPITDWKNFKAVSSELPPDKFKIRIGEKTSPQNLKQTVEHEIAHLIQKSEITSLDKELSEITLKGDDLFTNLPFDIDVKQSGWSEFKNSPDYLGRSKNYYLTGSGGLEKLPFASEVRSDLLEKGIIKHDYDKITPEMLEKHYNTYMKQGRNEKEIPLRLYDIMENQKSNFNKLSTVLNKLAVTTGVTTGLSQLKDNEPKLKKGGAFKSYGTDKLKKFIN